MHTVPIDLIAACVGILAALQCLSILLTHLETAARRIEGRSTWIARDGTAFEEFEVNELENSEILKHEFDEIRSEVALAVHLSTANG